MKNYVDFELSESLKEVGFDEHVNEYWFRNGGKWHECKITNPVDCNSDISIFELISRPTYDEAVNWLREKKGVYVYCDIFHKDGWIFGVKNLETLNIISTSFLKYAYPTYHEAQLDGIKEAVNYLKKLAK